MGKVIPFPQQPNRPPKTGPDDTDLMNAIIGVVEDFSRLRDYFILVANEPIETSVLNHEKRRQSRLELAKRFDENASLLLTLVKAYHQSHPQITIRGNLH